MAAEAPAGTKMYEHPQRRRARDRADQIAEHEAPCSEPEERQGDAGGPAREHVRTFGDSPDAVIEPLARQRVVGRAERFDEEAESQHGDDRAQR